MELIIKTVSNGAILTVRGGEEPEEVIVYQYDDSIESIFDKAIMMRELATILFGSEAADEVVNG